MPKTAEMAAASRSPAGNSAKASKRFKCSHPSCGKSFSRSEHLHRHALNHKEGNATCPRCATHFCRKDLLDRHMMRHREKDEQAGGEGLGVLATRKKLWRDPNGKIVNSRRPGYGVDSRRDRLNEASEQASSSEQARPESLTSDASMESPATSDRSQHGCSSSISSIPSTEQREFEKLMDMGKEGVWEPEMQNPSELDFLSNANWGVAGFPSSSQPPSLMCNDIFKPDTAMSFNAPFTTQNYYDFLFSGSNVSGSNAMNATQSNSLPISQPMDDMFTQQDATMALQTYPDMTQCLGQTASPSLPFVQNQTDPFSTCPTDPIGMARSVTIASSHTESKHSSPGSMSNTQGQSYTDSPRRYSPLDQPDYSSPLPHISESARKKLLETVCQFHPKLPDGTEILESDPLLSIFYLQRYSDLFFTRFNMTYPLIHQATFDPDSSHSFLLLAILLLGATYDQKDSHMMAVCIHDTMRAMIHSSPEFSTHPDLWMLQTILLVECFGKSRAGQNQHDMSHLYHGLLINLIRRSDCQTATHPPMGSHHTLMDYWHLAVEAESKRRLALLCFMWDTQHAVLFSQSLCMNASELNVTLPWDPEVWQAETAEEWMNEFRSYNTGSLPHYLPMLQVYTNPGCISPPPSLNALSRVLILHGLMSVSWDLHRRDQTSLGLAIAGKNEPWQFRMSRSYDAWKDDFSKYTSSQLGSNFISTSHRRRLEKLTVANLAIYHTAKIIVLSRKADIIDFQIFAGAGNIIGRPVTESDRQRSLNNILSWIEDDGRSAAIATWHAARLFREGAQRLENWDVDDMFHYPWCQYLAVLTCLSFHQAGSRQIHAPIFSPYQSDLTNPELFAKTDEEDSDWDAKVEMQTLISAITKLEPENPTFIDDMMDVMRKHPIHGLVKCMEKHLATIRWAVVREGVKVLSRLHL